jgi:chromate transporter
MDVTDRPLRVSLSEIAATFTRIGLGSFGGGILGWTHRETVVRRHWVNDREFLSGFALSQILPGANVVNLAIYLGMTVRGGAGATVAALGMLVLPIIAIILIFEIYAAIESVRVAHLALAGIAAAAIGLNIAAGIKAARVNASITSLTIAAAVFLMVGVMRWPMLPVMAAMTPLSLALAWRSRDG